MFQKVKEKAHEISLRQQQGNFNVQKSSEHNTCAHCQTTYEGYICPQCGQRSDSAHFTPNVVLHKMMDSVGFDERGNRSILRTIRDLLWRPGYMIRDYLGGHSAAYFQPFKLLLLLVLAYTLLAYLFGVLPEDTGEDVSNLSASWKNDDTKQKLIPLITTTKAIIRWLGNNMAYSIILQNIVIVTAMWKVYRKRAPYSWTETFIAQMYICCQFMILAIVLLLVTWKYHEPGILPYLVPSWMVIAVMIYDFYQLYDEQRIWPALWRVIKVELWIILMYALLLALFILVVALYTTNVIAANEA